MLDWLEEDFAYLSADHACPAKIAVALARVQGGLVGHDLSPASLSAANPSPSSFNFLNNINYFQRSATITSKRTESTFKMPAEISQPLPTQQMTASTPADSPCAVDEQPVSPSPTSRFSTPSFRPAVLSLGLLASIPRAKSVAWAQSFSTFSV